MYFIKSIDHDLVEFLLMASWFYDITQQRNFHCSRRPRGAVIAGRKGCKGVPFRSDLLYFPN
jgi:hypothetical protein